MDIDLSPVVVELRKTRAAVVMCCLAIFGMVAGLAAGAVYYLKY